MFFVVGKLSVFFYEAREGFCVHQRLDMHAALRLGNTTAFRIPQSAFEK
jgi:hypothetical protein